MRCLLLAALVVAFAAPAFGVTYHGKKNPDGTYRVRVQPDTTFDAEDIPLTTPAACISIEDESNLEIIYQVEIGTDRASQEQIYTFDLLVPAPAQGQRRDLRARSWDSYDSATGACSGLFSTLSVDDRAVWTGPPGQAKLLGD